MLETVCPACNAPLEVVQGRSVCTCGYCNSVIEIIKYGKNGMEPTCCAEVMDLQSLLDKTSVLVNQGAFEEAQVYCEMLMGTAPECADAYILALLCQLRLCHMEELGKTDTDLSSNRLLEQAMCYASKTQRYIYQKLLDSNQQRVHRSQQEKEAELARMKREKEAQIADISQKVQELIRFLEENKDKLLIPAWKKVLRVIEMIFVIGNVAFWTLGTLFVFPFIFIDAPFVIWLICIIRRNKRQKELPAKFAQAQEQVITLSGQLEEKTAAYNAWIAERNVTAEQRASEVDDKNTE